MAAVNVIMWVYNTPEAYLRQAVESVLNQTFRDFALFLYDDCSTDATKDILEEYAGADDRVTLYRTPENRLLTGDFNPVCILISGAAENPAGEYTCELDSDDWYEPDFLETAYGIAKTHGADLVAGDFLGFHAENLSALEIRNGPGGVYRGREEIADYWVNYYHLFRARWNKLIRADIYDKCMRVKFPPEVGTANDNYSMQSVIGECNTIAAIGRVTHHYRVRGESESKSLNPRSMLVRKHTALYAHALEILDKLGGTNEARVEKFREVLRAGIMSDDLSVLLGCMDKSPVHVIETLELALTDPTVWDICGGFMNYGTYFEQIFTVAASVAMKNGGNPRITGSFIALMAKIWVRTNRFSAVRSNDLTDFIAAVFDPRNVNNAGRVMLVKMLEACGAPFAAYLARLNRDALTDRELAILIAKRDSVRILGRLLSEAFASGGGDIIKTIYDTINGTNGGELMPVEFMRDFALETSLIYHKKPAETEAMLEERLNAALNTGGADAAENILSALLRAAYIFGNDSLFIQTRVRRLELFTLTEQREKADAEYRALEQLCDGEELETIRKHTNY